MLRLRPQDWKLDQQGQEAKGSLGDQKAQTQVVRSSAAQAGAQSPGWDLRFESPRLMVVRLGVDQQHQDRHPLVVLWRR